MADQGLYRDVLLDHYRNPRNKGDLAQADVVRRGRNPRCGDDIEVGVIFADEQLVQVRFRGRGCSVCLAAASMMTEAVSGQSKTEAQELCRSMIAWTRGETDTVPTPYLEAIDPARAHPARQRCVLLSWQALTEALGE